VPKLQQRRLLQLTRHFTNISSPMHRDALCDLARELAASDPAGEEDQHAAAVVLAERRGENVA